MARRRFPVRLKELRTERGMTQEALALKVRPSVSREYIARLETGKHDPPLSTLEKLAKALGVPVTELLE